jgi:hypothetical protein
MRRQLASLALVLSAAVGLMAMGRGPLGATPVPSPEGLAGWWTVHGPLISVFSLLRLAGLATAGYLTVISAAASMAQWAHWRGLARVVRRLLIPGTRWLVHGSLTLSLASAPVPQLMATVNPSPPAAPVLHRLEAPPGGVPAPRPEPRPGPRVRIARPGDSLWSLSEAALTAAWGRHPSDGELGPYWAAVVDANRARLPFPRDPDLIFPGLAVVVPATPSPPR